MREISEDVSNIGINKQVACDTQAELKRDVISKIEISKMC